MERDGQVINIASSIKQTTKGLSTELSGRNIATKKIILDHVFAFAGLAGGTGTSTILANVAYKLAKMGNSVLVIDINIMYPIQHSFFGIKQEIKTDDIVSYISGECTVGEAIKYTPGNKIGLLIANNRSLDKLVDVDSKTGAIALTECLERLGGLFDYILIDTNINLNNELTNAAMYRADKIITVMDESLECLSNYDRLVTAMGNCGIDPGRIRTVMNKRTSIFYNQKVLDDFGIELIEVLPFNLGVIESGLAGEIFSEKGASTAKTATEFNDRITDLAQIIQSYGSGIEVKD